MELRQSVQNVLGSSLSETGEGQSNQLQWSIYLAVNIVMRWTGKCSKNFKTPFFSRYSNFLSMSDWKWSKTTPVFFVSKYLKNYGRQRPSKFWPIWAVAGCAKLTKKFWPLLKQPASYETLMASRRPYLLRYFEM